MRTWHVVMLIILVMMYFACSSEQKPEYVEVPSGDPMAPDGTGEPIQDEPSDPQAGCDAPAPLEGYAPYLIEQQQEDKNDGGGFQFMPLRKDQKDKLKRHMPTSMLLLVPIGLAWVLRRRP